MTTSTPPFAHPRLARAALAGLAALCAAEAALAVQVCPAQLQRMRPDARYQAVATAAPAGSEVRDTVTGLVWRRCVLGMSWNGSACTGTPSALPWQDALQYITSATRTGGALAGTSWRIPNRNELLTLVESACYGPAVNASAFPSMPTDWNTRVLWSSSPGHNVVSVAWGLDSATGADQLQYVGNAYGVLLVRDP